MSDKASYSNHGFPWEARLDVATHILANQYLQILVNESEDPTYPKDNAIKDIPTMADAFRATLIVSNRTESQMLSNKFTVNHIKSQFDSNHSNPTETIKVNGKEGFKINDNTYEIFNLMLKESLLVPRDLHLRRISMVR